MGTVVDMGAMSDPFHLPDLIIGTSAQHRDNDYPFANLTQLATVSIDCFAQLPWELREIIAVGLQTQDALGLRLASRFFLFLFSSSDVSLGFAT